jgi:hypothetical protein
MSREERGKPAIEPSGQDRAEPEQRNGRVISGATVQMSGEAARIGMPRTDVPCEPTVEVVQDAGIIRAIDITCTCGRKTRVHCVY